MKGCLKGFLTEGEWGGGQSVPYKSWQTTVIFNTRHSSREGVRGEAEGVGGKGLPYNVLCEASVTFEVTRDSKFSSHTVVKLILYFSHFVKEFVGIF